MKSIKQHNLMPRVTALLLAVVTALACLSPSVSAEVDTSLYNTWIATDALGRTTPTAEEAGERREDASVGIFYFMFMDPVFNTAEIVDFSKFYEQGGAQAVWNGAVTGGFHIWAEPYFGYYINTDEWVLRKHAYMLSEAGVDFIYLDVTNNAMYQHCWEEIFRVWKEIRDEGQHTPQICFSFGMSMYPENLEIIIDKIYTPDENGVYEYQDLWFMWEGKPLMLGDFSSVDEETKSFFTTRYSWAYTEKENNSWPWIQLYPQTAGYSPDGEMEQMAVAAGFHANSSHGRSLLADVKKSGRVLYSQTVNGKLDFGYSLPETARGLAFAQQWSYAIEQKPKLVMLTGWNEFTFGKHINAGIGQTVASMYKVVENDPIQSNNYIDAMTAEYSRDIEPIKGQFGDNYFYQMAYYIRLFKGVDPIPESSASFDVNMEGDLSEFDAAEAVYRDVVGDITHRDYTSIGDIYRYVNTTGRNDLMNAKVSKTDKYVYFYVDCAADIITDSGENWMNLYVNTDRSYNTGWEGYDFIINRGRTDSTCTVERFYSGEWDEAKTVGEAVYTVAGDRMVIRVDAELLELDGRDSFDFKWADNSTTEGDPMQFLDLGDSAPNDRYRFRYIKTGGTYTDELLNTVPPQEGTDTTPESRPDGRPEGQPEDDTETQGAEAHTDTQTDDGGAVVSNSATILRGTWIIVLGADILLAVLIAVAIIQKRKGSAS